MKNRIFLVIAAFLFVAVAHAQSTVDSIAAKYKLIPMPEPLTVEKTFPVLGTYQFDATTAAVVNSSVASENTTTSPAANAAPAETTTSSAAVSTEVSTPGSVTITLDPENKGLIWVEGLPQGKFKAYLKKSPSTYRIVSQKTESGEKIEEGTLMFDPETKMLNIALGKAYDDADPAAIFALNPALNPASTTEAAPVDNTVKIKTKTATTKSKAKVSYFTASKVEQTPSATTTTTSDATTAPATQQPMQQQQSTPAPAPTPAPQQ